MINLQGKTTLITGGAVRIGRAIAHTFAKAGSRVIIHCNHSREKAEELRRELDRLADGNLVVQADLTNAQQRGRLIPELVAAGKIPDFLINNASVYRRRPLATLTEEEIAEDYGVNFIAPLLLMGDFARHCQRGGIINLLDQRVAVVDPGAGIYGLAKKSLRDATEAAAVAWAPDIRVNAVAPGLVLPPPGVAAEKMLPLLENVPLRRSTPTVDIAEACLFLATSESITGQILFVDGGLHLVSPVRPEKG